MAGTEITTTAITLASSGVGVAAMKHALKDTVLGKVLGDLVGVFGGDRLASWRIKNAGDILSALASDLNKKGLELDTSNIPEGFVYSWFQKATTKDDKNLQEMFAKLLQSAIEHPEGSGINISLIDMLDRLSPDDALTFKGFADQADEPDFSGFECLELKQQDLLSIPVSQARYFERSIEHLITVGILSKSTAIDLDLLCDQLTGIVNTEADEDGHKSVDSSTFADLQITHYRFTGTGAILASELFTLPS